MIVLLDQWGWTNSLLTLALIMILALVPLVFYQEPKRYSNPSTSSFKTSSQDYFNSFLQLVRLPQIGYWFLLLVLYAISGSIAKTMFRPLLVDLGLSLSEIGWLLGIVDQVAMIAGGIIGGSLIMVWGRQRSLIAFIALSFLTGLTYLIPVFGANQNLFLYLIVISNGLTFGMMTATLLTIMMDKSSPETAGTDYSVQNSVSLLGGIPGAAMSGIIARFAGYGGVFLLSILLLLSCLRLATRFVDILEPNQHSLINSSEVN